MSEFVWKDQIKVTLQEISRGDQFAIWRDIQKAGFLNGETPLEENEAIAELIAARSVSGVFDCEKNQWKAADTILGHPLPITPETFGKLPMTLANGIIRAALDENGGLLETVSFPSASLGISSAGSESKPASESSPE